VLVVDDEAIVRMLVTETLADLGCQVLEASEAKGGLKILDSDVRVDLLITDVGLPGDEWTTDGRRSPRTPRPEGAFYNRLRRERYDR
jgi:CheY-like chemotaxis protein